MVDYFQLKKFPPLNWEKRVFIASDISNGLKYLHTAFEAPFIHRDIKSANILLNSEDTAKVSVVLWLVSYIRLFNLKNNFFSQKNRLAILV